MDSITIGSLLVAGVILLVVLWEVAHIRLWRRRQHTLVGYTTRARERVRMRQEADLLAWENLQNSPSEWTVPEVMATYTMPPDCPKPLEDHDGRS